MRLLFLSLFVMFNSFLFSQCSDYSSESLCDNSNDCGWVEDIQSGWCGNHNSASSCPDYPACSWGCDGCWYLGECCGSTICSGGYYEQDNSFCEEIEMPECSEMNQSECGNDSGCDWIEDIEIIYCNTLSTSGWGPGVCEYYYPDCYNYLAYGGSYGSWSTQCGGGTTQIDNSYCEDMQQYMLGDINQDQLINVSDVIIAINFILDNSYNDLADLNEDHDINIQDVVLLINIILD